MTIEYPLQDKFVYVQSRDGTLHANFYPFKVENRDLICPKHKMQIVFLVEYFACPACEDEVWISKTRNLTK